MAGKQSVTKARAAARAREAVVTTVRIRVLISFNGMYAGDEADVTMDHVVQGWINAHVVKVLSTSVVKVPQVVEPPKERVMSGGEAKAGQSGSEPADPGSEPE